MPNNWRTKANCNTSVLQNYNTIQPLTSYQQFAVLEAKSWSNDSRGAKVPFRPLHTKAALWQKNLLSVTLRNWHSAGNSYTEWWCWFGRSATFFLNSWTYLIEVKVRKTKKLAVWQTMRVWGEIVLGSINLKPRTDWMKSLHVSTRQVHFKFWSEQSFFNRLDVGHRSLLLNRQI